jgi:PadR family transcriptional regulator AphA
MRGGGATWVILGLLAMRPRSGYEIKAVVDRSTRFFWAASYSQIYPELRRLEDEGLVEGEDAANGARQRRVYRLRNTAPPALTDSLHGHTTTIEHRDESLLRLFFADVQPREEALGLLEARVRGHEQFAQELRAIDARPGTDPDFVDLALRWGIALNEFGARWCAEEAERLRSGQ